MSIKNRAMLSIILGKTSRSRSSSPFPKAARRLADFVELHKKFHNLGPT